MNSVAPPLAGIFHMRRGKFFFFNGLGTVIFVGSFSSVGYLMADEIERHSGRILEMGGWLGGVLLVAFAAFILFKYFNRRKAGLRLGVPRIMPDLVKKRVDSGEDLLIIDVRGDLEMEAEPFTLPGAFHVPLEQIEKNPRAFPSNRDIILYCT